VSTDQRLDIGGGHTLVLVTPDGGTQPTGADVEHVTPDGKTCTGWIAFDVPAQDWLPAERKWQVQSWEPLTLSPSLACGCGDHGFVREGRWVLA
jgi:hypothetical protein